MAASRRADRDDDLALFLEMQKRDRERKSTAMRPVVDSNSNVNAEPAAARPGNSALYRMATSAAVTNAFRGRTAGEELLASDMGKNDYDWLLTPPGTPLVTGTENDPMVDTAYISSQKGLPNLVRSLTTIKTARTATTSRSDPMSRMSRTSLYGPGSVTNRRSSLAPSTTSAPSSRPASRPSTPTSRPTISSSNSNISSSNKSAAIASTATSRASVASRSSTPLRRPSTPVMNHNQSQPAPNPGGRSASANKATSIPSRNAPASRGSSPTVRGRAWQPSSMPGFSLEPPPNLRTTLPARSVSNSRGASVGASKSTTGTSSAPTRPGQSASPSMGPVRPGGAASPSLGPSRPGTLRLSKTMSSPSLGPSSLSSPSASVISSRAADGISDRARRQSSSPIVTRGRPSTGERSVSRSGRSEVNSCDTSARGSKMADRMLQSRRLPASSLSPDEVPSSQLKRVIKCSTPSLKDSSSCRNASRKSIDVALRHMDVRQSSSNGFRAIVSNIPSSFYSIRSINGRIRPGHSPLTTSSTASSEHSMSITRDLEGSEIGDEVCSEIGSRASPISAPDSLYSISKESRVSNWIDSPDYRDDNVDLMQLMRQGMDKLPAPETPLGCQHGSGPNCNLCSIKKRLKSLKVSPMSAESMRLSPYSGSSNGALSPSGSHG